MKIRPYEKPGWEGEVFTEAISSFFSLFGSKSKQTDLRTCLGRRVDVSLQRSGRKLIPNDGTSSESTFLCQIECSSTLFRELDSLMQILISLTPAFLTHSLICSFCQTNSRERSLYMRRENLFAPSNSNSIAASKSMPHKNHSADFSISLVKSKIPWLHQVHLSTKGLASLPENLSTRFPLLMRSWQSSERNRRPVILPLISPILMLSA